MVAAAVAQYRNMMGVYVALCGLRRHGADLAVSRPATVTRVAGPGLQAAGRFNAVRAVLHQSGLPPSDAA